MEESKFNDLLPKGILFNLKEIEQMKLIKIAMAKKLIYNKEIEVIKIGNKLHISRYELIRYLESNKIEVSSYKEITLLSA